MSEELSARLRRVGTQIKAFRELHSQELQLILDELLDIAAAVEEAHPAPSHGADASPKRAKWLAEQEERAHRSRRDLLRGRERG